MEDYQKMRAIWESLDKKLHNVEDLSEKQGVPDDVDPDKWERCVQDVKKQDDVDNPYAICNASLSEEDEELEEGKKKNDKAGHTDGKVTSLNKATGERGVIGKPGKTHISSKKDKANKRNRRKDQDRKEISKYTESEQCSDEELLDLMQYIKENRNLVRDVLAFVDLKMG